MSRFLPPPRQIEPYGNVQPQIPFPTRFQEEEEIDFDLRSIWGVVHRHRWPVLACVVLGFGGAMLYNSWATPIYRASASLRIDADQGSTVTPTGTDVLGMGAWTQLETEMEVIKSRQLAERVADSLKLQITLAEPDGVGRDELLTDLSVGPEVVPAVFILERDDTGTFVQRGEDGTALSVIRVGHPVKVNGFGFTLSPASRKYEKIRLVAQSRAGAAGVVRGGLDVQRPHDYADFVLIGYQGPDRYLAAQIPNAIAEQFIAHKLREQKTRARSIVGFLREQISALEVQLWESEEEFRTFREGANAVDLEAEGQSRLGQLAELRAQRDAFQAEGAALGKLLHDVESKASRPDPLQPSPYRRLVAFPTLMSNAAVNTIFSSLVELESQRSQLLATRSPKNPDVQVIAQRIQDLESQLHVIASTYHEGLGNNVGSLGAVLSRAGGELSQIPGKEAEFVRLQRETDLLQEIHTLLETRLKEAEITEAADESKVHIVDAAAVPGGPIAPQRSRNMMFGLLLGLMLGVSAAYIREHLDDTVHTRDDLQEIARVPVLGLIPRIRNGKMLNGRANGRLNLQAPNSSESARVIHPQARDRLIVATDPRHAVAEAFRSLRTNITFTSKDQIPKTLLLTSAKMEDGKTTSTINLTIAFAQQGLRILLIDADLRRGIVHRIFGHRRAPGLSELLIGKADQDEAIRPVRIDQDTQFDILSTGTLPPNPAELVGSSKMGTLIEELEKKYDGILIDTPPLTLVTDAAILATYADGVFVVARAGQTEERAIHFAMEQLRNVQAPVRGTILNDIDSRDRRYGSYDYYAYQYEYHGSDGHEKSEQENG